MISKLVKSTSKFVSKMPTLINNHQFNSSFVKKILEHPYSRLCRYDKPIGCMLLYWPVTWGLAIGSSTFPPSSLLFLFFMGAWTSRSAGCIINDYLDKDFDKKVQRTKLRPLASREVTVKEAMAVMFANLSGGLYVLTQLPISALMATFTVLPIAALYPLAKRYTKYPQFILGIAFNSGVIIGALTLGSFENYMPMLLIYSAGICWTLIYDTVYAFQDIKDDKKLGLFSTAITWQKNTKSTLNQMAILSLIFSCSTALFQSSYLYCLPAFFATHAFLLHLIRTVNLQNRQSCANFFKKNNYIGFFIFLSLCLKFLKEK